jgi:hypothetical protein
MQESHLLCLKTAFGFQVARRIVDADDILDYSEVELLGTLFPSEVLQQTGLMSSEGHFTPLLKSAYDEALIELPNHLPHSEKLELLTSLYQTCMADGELHPGEMQVLTDAATKLGVSSGQLREHLDAIALGHGADVPPVKS